MQTEIQTVDEKHDRKSVNITVDGKSVTVAKEKYTVSAFKTLIGVAHDYELDEVVKGVFTPLDDTAEIHVKAGDVFVSHVRQGSSS